MIYLYTMRHILLIFGYFLMSMPHAMAEVTVTPDTEYLSSALFLYKSISTQDEQNPFDGISFKPVIGEEAPLARYTPTKNGTIEVGQNFKRYQKEFVVLSTSQDRLTRADFSQYMTVLTILSLANESAHRMQDLDGSLQDYFNFVQQGKNQESCSLYALQQQVSDIVMMEKSVRLYQFFEDKNSSKGLSALRMALEKMNLQDDFLAFQAAFSTPNDKGQLNRAIENMRKKRSALNIAGLKSCIGASGSFPLPTDIVDRAVNPARKALNLYSHQEEHFNP